VVAALEHVHFVCQIAAAVRLLVGRLDSQRIRERYGRIVFAMKLDHWCRLVGVP
jgi:hypothetical protein